MKYVIFFLLFGFSSTAHAQQQVKNQNWSNKQLMEPLDLAQKIRANKSLPVIISIGPQALIPHSIDVGMMTDEENSKTFHKLTDSLSRDANVVIYCGCCPFEHCPNIRPAIATLKEKGFKNFHLLNLSTSIKADWIDKNYPIHQEN